MFSFTSIFYNKFTPPPPYTIVAEFFLLFDELWVPITPFLKQLDWITLWSFLFVSGNAVTW